jgi:hypothetical protein
MTKPMGQKNDAIVWTDSRGFVTVYMLRPLTPAAQEWINENVAQDALENSYFGDSLVVEHRYIMELVEGMRRDGLVVR